MSITVKIPTQLRDLAGGAAQVQAEGTTVAEALESVFAAHGELRDRLYQEDGDLRRFINVYLSGEDIRFLDGLQTAVPANGELTILPAVAGG
jgi:molybdopterin converting factor small subunit